MTTLNLGNNESATRGVVEESDGTFTALGLSASKTGFKTRKGAERWLARRTGARKVTAAAAALLVLMDTTEHNPFIRLADKHPTEARELATIVAAVHPCILSGNDQLWAAVRAVRSLTGKDLGPFLSGSYFAEWQGSDGTVDGDVETKELHRLAGDYLDQLRECAQRLEVVNA